MLDAYVAIHPSRVSMPADIEQIAKPGMFQVAETDSRFSPATIPVIKEVLEKKGVSVDAQVYEKVEHGFAIRGNDSDEHVLKQRLRSMNEMIAFFKAQL